MTRLFDRFPAGRSISPIGRVSATAPIADRMHQAHYSFRAAIKLYRNGGRDLPHSMTFLPTPSRSGPPSSADVPEC